MAPRELVGIALVIAGVLLAPVAIILGRLWWVVVIVVLSAGLILFLSRRVVSEEERTGNQMSRGPGGLGLGAHRPARVTSDTSQTDAADNDGD